jgi:hypothetical protein
MRYYFLVLSLLWPAASLPLLADPVDPTAIIEARLKQIARDPAVTYKTNDNYVFCTAHCRDLNERNAIYDAFRNVPKYGLTATKNPPTVCVVLLLDPAAYQSSQQSQKLVSHMANSELLITGKVLQRTKDGLLVSTADNHLVLVADGPNLIDDDAISVAGYYIGNYEFTQINGAQKTVRKYTCDRNAAVEHWAPLAAEEAKAEAQKRADNAQNAPEGSPSEQK